ncbi:MAG TPA: ABC transporter ATP-binding protein [Bryobacteraceae bacterium]
MFAIEFEGVSKSYPIYEKPGHRLTELVTFNHVRRHRDFWALRDVSFQVKPGETFCIVGENGSGKSTLLQLVAGIFQPSEGKVRVNGRVSALLELGSGFNPEFSGRDNVYMNGAILGFSAAGMDEKYQAIIDFAEIGDFIDQPVKTYSSGMAVRLAFSVAIHVDPDILLVVEALAVGDVYFRQRCMRKVHELRDRGTTILFVSHATGDVKALGDRALWLNHGRVEALGTTESVVSKYLAAMSQKDKVYAETHGVEPGQLEDVDEIVPDFEVSIPNVDHRYGDGRAEILGIGLFDEMGTPLQMLEPSSTVVVKIVAKAKSAIDLPNVGFMLRDHLGVDFAGTNTSREGHQLARMKAGDIVSVNFHVELPALYATTFSFSPAIADGTLDTYVVNDWIDNALVVPMARSPQQIYGLVHLKCRVEINQKPAFNLKTTVVV